MECVCICVRHLHSYDCEWLTLSNARMRETSVEERKGVAASVSHCSRLRYSINAMEGCCDEVMNKGLHILYRLCRTAPVDELARTDRE